MSSKYKHETFRLENQDGCGEDTFVHIDETIRGKVSLTFSGEEDPCVFIETFGEEIRIMVYNVWDEEPQVVVLDAISGGW